MTRRALPWIGLLAVVVGAVLLLTRDGGGHRVEAEFADAAGLRVHSPVRVGGARVGSVAAIRVTDRDTALAELRLDDRLRPGVDARARVRPANLLGEKFVELEIGDRARPLDAGVRIPLTRTSTPVELDDVVDVLDPTTRGRLGVLLGSLGVALEGRGEELRAALRVLPDTIEDAGDLARQLAGDRTSLVRLLEATDRVTSRLDDERRELGRVVEQADRALRAPAREHDGLGRLVATVPSTLRRLRTSLGRIDRTGAALRPAAEGLRAAAPPLADALAALPPLERRARPALVELRRTAPAVRKLGADAPPTLDRLRAALEELRGLGADGDPLAAALDEHAGDLLGFAENWARAVQTRDPTGHVFRVSINVQLEILRALVGASTPPPARARDARTTAARTATASPRAGAAGPSGGRQSTTTDAAPAPTTASPAAADGGPAGRSRPTAAPTPGLLAPVTDALTTILDRLGGR
ncbi:MAG: MlaD family protein [Solirubrobacteraceae bacterium]|nr:MlaD family protein [Solirubrobacteraceae bacterium]